MGMIINPANDIIKIGSLNKGLVGHWPLDKQSLRGSLGLADKTPYSNHGVSANTPVFITDRMGQTDRALSFDGESDYVDCGDDESLDITDEITVMLWAKWDGTAQHEALIQKGTTYRQSFLMASGGDGAIVKVWGSHDGTLWDYDSLLVGTLETDVWHNMAFTLSQSIGLQTYFDGQPITFSSTKTTLRSLPTENLFIGARALSQHFNGSIADVRIYNRALSQQEITTLYDAYRPKLSAGSLQKGLVFDMPLTSTYTKDETAGSEVMTDRTAYSNDGQNSGGDVDTDHTSFNGTSDNVRISDSESLSPINAMSAMVWVNGAAQNDKGIVSKYDIGVAKHSWRINVTSVSPYQKMRITISDDGTLNGGHRKYYDSSIDILNNTWHLAGFTFNAGTLKLYIDGVEDTNPTKGWDDAITTIFASDQDVTVGCYLNNDTPVYFFDGDLAKAKMWNRALTDAEWLLAYDKTKGLYL